MVYHTRMPMCVLTNVLGYICHVKEARAISLNWIIITAWNTLPLCTRNLHKCFSIYISKLSLYKKPVTGRKPVKEGKKSQSNIWWDLFLWHTSNLDFFNLHTNLYAYLNYGDRNRPSHSFEEKYLFLPVYSIKWNTSVK